MKLIVFSHKETWPDPASPCGYSTVGGFPFQMDYISRNFDSTTLLLPIRPTPIPKGARPLTGHLIHVTALPEPEGKEWRRKISMLFWTARHWHVLWKAIASADAVHAPVGGDVGLIGISLSLIQRKYLFVRHCGNWEQSISIVDSFTHWLLEKIAGGRNVVMATGGAKLPPSPKNRNISWIFSTSYTENEWANMPQAPLWQTGEPLRLVFVGRLSAEKNVRSILDAFPILLGHYKKITLDILGDGETTQHLKLKAKELSIGENIHFHGNVSHENVLKILGQSHLFVFPSLSEGFPKAVLEAMACRLPVVVSPVSVLPNLIGSTNGVLLESTDDAGICQAVLRLIKDAKQMNQFAVNARKKSRMYTLERWQKLIAGKLESAWGKPLRETEDG